MEVVSYDHPGKRIRRYPKLIIDGDEFHSCEEICSWIANESNVSEDIVEIEESKVSIKRQKFSLIFSLTAVNYIDMIGDHLVI